ncbi:MAG: ParB N-terminal domain-containing protein [candidate division KSB1 bacterium]|jgi:hypothetical protein|nr:ParB N-terminal domain-containing protein [candidate division KSB1 bacterium]
MNNHSLTNVVIHDIDLADRTYVFTFEPYLTMMIESIKKTGLLHPPVLALKSNKPVYRIISGLKRILALAHLKVTTVEAVVVDEVDADPDLDRFLMNFYDNVSTRDINPIEKSFVLNILKDRFNLDDKTILDQFCPMLGLGSNPKVLDNYLPLCQMEDNLKIAVVEEFISPEMCAGLSRYSSKDRCAFLSLFYALRLGKNRQKEFIRLITDISMIEDKEMSEVIGQEKVQLILGDEGRNLNARLIGVKDILRQQRYPKFMDAETKFNQLKKELKLPPQISVNPPPFFESDKYSIRFEFKDQTEFDNVMKILGRISEGGRLKKLDTLIG